MKFCKRRLQNDILCNICRPSTKYFRRDENDTSYTLYMQDKNRYRAARSTSIEQS